MTNMNTPRTDKIWEQWANDLAETDDLRDFARQLETELNDEANISKIREKALAKAHGNICLLVAEKEQWRECAEELAGALADLDGALDPTYKIEHRYARASLDKFNQLKGNQ